jgi:catechol 2,3-dioxygenase-like lactoylglutathione lyase family enzyme
MKKANSILVAACFIFLVPGFLPSCQTIGGDNFTDHPMDVGVVVSDLEKSLDFYTNVIGMTRVSTFHVAPEMAGGSGLTEYKGIDIINLKLNDEAGSPIYKLARIQDVVNEPISNSFQPGFRYISLLVTDINPYLNRIKEHHIELWNKKPRELSRGIWVLVVRDPDGAMIEIIGPMKK